MAPYAAGDAANGWPVAWLCAAAGAMFTDVENVVRVNAAGVPGWARLFDLSGTQTWTLPWVTNWTGGRLPSGLSPVAQREYVGNLAAHRRGTAAHLLAAARRSLTGTRNARIVERNNSPYRFLLLTRTAETPSSAQVIADVTAVKPAGLTFTHELRDGPVVDEGTRTINAATATIDAAVIADVT